jgi:hypothetical protein
VLAYRLAGGSGSIDHDLANAPKNGLRGESLSRLLGWLVIGAYAQQPAMPVIGFPP